ncbi:PAS domain-containing protein [Paenibacillus chibensis]|uniref:PAS domain-containing protein n=1 Tax=Paenibacillus chibensis TaxID=59846 RepID=A0ABU6PWL9_9BACL|nr:PAS domain-containing protein [Paenibacillus chibensis]
MQNSGISSLEIIQSLKQAVAIIDHKGYILSVNPVWIRNSLESGVSGSFDWIGVNYLQIFAAISDAEGNASDALDAVLDGTTPYFRAEIQSHFQKTMKWLQLEATTIFDGDGPTAKGMVISLTDFTKCKLLEHDLLEALTQLRTLSGLLPICAVCKRIRDEHDIWNSVESFLQKHTHAEFTHDICPECIRRLYPKYSSILDSCNNS